MTSLFSNPELVRNLRAQLRPGRMLAVAAICVALASAIIVSQGYSGATDGFQWERTDGAKLLTTMLWFQALALVFGGGIACVQAIHREKELNTFDFQRVTRLTPLELGLGKLFGAPALAYFVALCFLPFALWGAATGGAHASFIVAAYALLVLGAIVFHAFGLLLSLQLQRGSSSAAVLLFLLLVLFGSTGNGRTFFNLGRLSPFVAIDLAQEESWQLAFEKAKDGVTLYPTAEMTDIFFGRPVHHAAVLAVLYLTFAGWLLLALQRNLKRDPAVYEVYTPAQALALVLYLNLWIFGFFSWLTNINILRPLLQQRLTPLEAQQALLGLNLFLFFALGLVLLRNRERWRRRLRERARAAVGWLQAAWPAPYLVGGAALVGAAVLAEIHWKRDPAQPWDWRLTLVGIAALAFWVARDVLYLQWMNLRRARRPLLMGALYLIVFYTCVTIVFSALDYWRAPLTAIFLPGTLLGLEAETWALHRGTWLVALAAQALLAVLFVLLQRQRLREISAAPHPTAPGR